MPTCTPGLALANKYGARKTVVDGITFDSAAEANRYRALSKAELVGEIAGLELQPVFVLAEGVKLHGEKRKRPAIRYRADFSYVTDSGEKVVEDVKGMDTPMSRLKRHLMATIHGIQVRLI